MLGTIHYNDAKVEVTKLVVGPFDNNVFIIRCRQSGESVLIDAANEHEKLLELCRNLNVQRVLETHGHWDHIAAVPQLRDAGYSVGVSQGDSHMLDTYDEIIEDESIIEVGRLRIATIATPGHTQGSICFALQGTPLLFSGDTLFPGGPGKTWSKDDFATILNSIETRLFKFDPTTIVLPGHGLDTSIGSESLSIDQWAERGW